MTNHKLLGLLVGAGISVAGSEAIAQQNPLQEEANIDRNAITSFHTLEIAPESLVNGGCGNGGCGNSGCGNGSCR